MSVFGEQRIWIDPWDVNYGDQSPLNAFTADMPEVNVEVELPRNDWGPVSPQNQTNPFRRICVIDGTRRIEARMHLQREQTIIPGAFGSFAVGAAELRNGKAQILDARVRHLAILSDGEVFPGDIAVHDGLIYSPASTPETGSDAAIQHLQNSMRNAEALLGAELATEESLVIADGPLRFETDVKCLALGYIKRIHETYIGQELLPTLLALPEKTRTPLFAMPTGRGSTVFYSWFVRLAAPQFGSSPLHGLARLECPSKNGLDRAREVADFTAWWLSTIAPSRGRDPRSPQNLLPIAAVEAHLRRLMGDRKLIRRWIESLIAKEASNRA